MQEEWVLPQEDLSAPVGLSSFSLDDSMILDSSSLVPEDFKSYITKSLLRIPLVMQVDLVQLNTHRLLDFHEMTPLGRDALPFNDDLLELENALWYMLASLAPTAKCTNKHHIPTSWFKCFYSHPALNSLIIMAANERACREI